MYFQNLNLNTYPYKEFIDLFEKFPGEIYPWVGNFSEAPTGEEYITVNADSSDDYIKSVKTFFSLSNEDDVLYFRRFPGWLSYNDKPEIYSRFLISSKPVIQFADSNHITDQERFKPIGKDD